jgi:hypothetical protein
MEIKNTKLAGINQSIENVLSSYRSGKIDDRELSAEADRLKMVTNSELVDLTNKIRGKKFPLSSSYTFDSKRIGEMQKQRAYSLLGQPISLIQSELAKEMEARNHDFCFTLAESIFTSDYTRADKARLTNLYNSLLKETGIADDLNDRQQAQILLKQVDGITNNIGRDREELVRNVYLERSAGEIAYTRKRDSEPSLEADVIFRSKEKVV